MQFLSRRQLLTRTSRAALAVSALAPLAPLLAAPEQRGFRIGACDWSIGKMADPAALDVAREIGLDGVQVSLGTAANDMSLRTEEVQAKYRDAAKRTGVAVASLAIGELNNVPYKSDPRTIDWVNGSIDACHALGSKVILLAFFGSGDLRGDKAGTDEVVRRLKAAAPQAERRGVILAIESWLSAEDHVDIIQRVGSPAVQVYYDVCNSTDRGYDILKEIRWLGKQKLICEFHAKENGALLGQGNVNFKAVRQAMDDIGYSGWIQIEGAVPKGGSVKDSYPTNLAFLRGIFPPEA
jgi:sugar phosphate isomerase/epimerase